jgi:hypothetical protein
MVFMLINKWVKNWLRYLAVVGNGIKVHVNQKEANFTSSSNVWSEGLVGGLGGMDDSSQFPVLSYTGSIKPSLQRLQFLRFSVHYGFYLSLL